MFHTVESRRLFVTYNKEMFHNVDEQHNIIYFIMKHFCVTVSTGMFPKILLTTLYHKEQEGWHQMG